MMSLTLGNDLRFDFYDNASPPPSFRVACVLTRRSTGAQVTSQEHSSQLQAKAEAIELLAAKEGVAACRNCPTPIEKHSNGWMHMHPPTEDRPVPLYLKHCAFPYHSPPVAEPQL